MKKSENNKVHVFISDWSGFDLTGMYVIDLFLLFFSFLWKRGNQYKKR